MDNRSANRKDTNNATLRSPKQLHKKIKIIGMMRKNVASKEENPLVPFDKAFDTHPMNVDTHNT